MKDLTQHEDALKAFLSELTVVSGCQEEDIEAFKNFVLDIDKIDD